jgi:hypothetical protein
MKFVIVFLIILFVILFGGFLYVNNLNKITGRVSGLGQVNITILPLLEINLSQAIINWSSGRIDEGEYNSTLYTNGSEVGVVLRGNWSGDNATAFLIENVGSTNCSLFMIAGKNASILFNSSDNSNQEYKWKIVEKEANSCINGTGSGGGWNAWADVNLTGPGTNVCSLFSFDNGADEVYINVLLTVPYNARNFGNISDSITVICNGV